MSFVPCQQPLSGVSFRANGERGQDMGEVADLLSPQSVTSANDRDINRKSCHEAGLTLMKPEFVHSANIY